jgi:hypothetical protein
MSGVRSARRPSKSSQGAVHIACGVFAGAAALMLTRVPRFKEFMSLDHAQVADWYAREYPHAFATQPERTAR